MLKLYYSPGACSLASHIALHEAGVPFEAVRVEGRGKKTAGGEDYANVTPKGYVPALRLESGEVLTEGTAIMPYVADLAPAKHLAPANGTLERYRLHEWLGYINSELHKSFGPLFTPGMTDEGKTAAKAVISRKLDFTQSQIETQKFVLGDTFSVADAYLFTILGWLAHVGMDLSQWPHLKAFRDRIAARPSVQAAMQAEGLLK